MTERTRYTLILSAHPELVEDGFDPVALANAKYGQSDTLSAIGRIVDAWPLDHCMVSVPTAPPAPDSMALRLDIVKRGESGKLNAREFAEAQKAIGTLRRARARLERLGMEFSDTPQDRKRG